VQRDFHLARVGDDVIVGEDVAIFVDDKARSLTVLRNQPVKEVERHDARRNVHHGWNIPAIDADIVLLFAVEPFAAGSLGDLHLRGMAEPVHRIRAGQFRIRTPSGEVEECAGDYQREHCRSYEFHRFKPSGPRTGSEQKAQFDSTFDSKQCSIQRHDEQSPLTCGFLTVIILWAQLVEKCNRVGVFAFLKRPEGYPPPPVSWNHRVSGVLNH